MKVFVGTAGAMPDYSNMELLRQDELELASHGRKRTPAV